jgi:hypothetical protein
MPLTLLSLWPDYCYNGRFIICGTDQCSIMMLQHRTIALVPKDTQDLDRV